ncbi:unnamed protein product [Haemonchus placei]|uniref:BMERB domain-containing protein n=1 Tax=Haemonchus placei TaxID=6290 RepID=A0A0N4W244_HAEPC|nr:unnamed protein product [Haemonchus placei]
MDLIDLYHADDEHFASPDINDNQAFVHKFPNGAEKLRKASTKMKKPRFVPWEPFRAAPSADRKGQIPVDMPELIPYSTKLLDEDSDRCSSKGERLVDTRRNRTNEKDCDRSEKEIYLEKQLVELKSELEIERKLNSELKRLMVATISDELQGQVEALTEDKIRLAHRVEEYTERLLHEDEQVDQLLIDRDVWKCKFLAQSIRTDELNIRLEFLLGMLRDAQRVVREMWYALSFFSFSGTSTFIFHLTTSRRALDIFSNEFSDGASNVSKDATYLANLDLATFFTRSPCDERVQRKTPNYANVTVSCCPKCFGREIHLL